VVVSRRTFLHGSAASLASLAWVSRPRLAPATLLTLDCLSIEGPEFDPAPALAAGLTGAVLDLPIYPRSRANALEALASWETAFTQPNGRFQPIVRADDFDAALAQGKFAVVLACQDASILDVPSRSVDDANLVHLREFFEKRLRVLQLAHGDRNGVGDSFRERTDAGLSRLGEDVVAEMNRLGMLVDLSHCSDRTTLEAIRISQKPCVVTHAGCRALYPTKRNKTDEAIRALAEKGGVFGVFCMTLWLTDAERATVDDVTRHVDHALQVAGEDHVVFGSDGPVMGVPSIEAELSGMQAYSKARLGIPGSERVPTHVRAPELNGPNRWSVLADALKKHGHPARVVDKVMGRNFARVFRDVVG
jgi:membrane dipeptidase